jgi:mono/diheme cytochrome c family protein
LTRTRPRFYPEASWIESGGRGILRRLIILCTLAAVPMAAAAQDRRFTLSVPPELESTGFLDYLLPRFSLKTQVRIARAPDGDLALVDRPPGKPVFTRGETVWRLRGALNGADERRFVDWITSQAGRATIESYPPGGTPLFSADLAAEPEETAPALTGDAARGADLSLDLCGRCHVVDARNPMAGLGSTPSFGVLRTLADWEQRFLTFYDLKPHPAFTQVDGVTEPFHDARPPTSAPIEMTLDEVEAIAAFAASLPAADLGAPVQMR